MSEIAKRHTDTVAVITGGAQGVGFAIARQLAAEGCRKITLAGRDTGKGAKACAKLEKLGCEAQFVPTDMASATAPLE